MSINNKQWCITPKDVYGKDIIEKAPEGYEFTGEFRPPKPGDCFLTSASGNDVVELGCLSYRNVSPRLILRKKPKTYTDTEIVDFLIEQVHNYMLGKIWDDIYKIVGDMDDHPVSAVSRETIMEVMRKRGV